MAKLIITLIVLVAAQEVASRFCYSTTFPDGTHCDWGCCYTYIYPCCDTPFYVTPAFIVPIVLGSVGVVIAVVAGVIIVVVRRRRAEAMPQFGTVLSAPQLVATAPGVHSYAAYYSPNTVNQVTQVHSETTPMAMQWTTPQQVPYLPTETTPMIVNQTTQCTTTQQVPYLPTETSPMYTAQPANVHNPHSDELPKKQ